MPTSHVRMLPNLLNYCACISVLAKRIMRKPLAYASRKTCLSSSPLRMCRLFAYLCPIACYYAQMLLLYTSRLRVFLGDYRHF